MKQQIGGLADRLGGGAGHGGESQFHCFFADFLRDAPGALCDETGRVAALRPVLRALCNDAFESDQKRHRLARGTRRLLAPAGARVEMTGRPAGIGEHQQRVAVAIRGNLAQLEIVARRLALGPQPGFAAAPKRHPAACPGLLQRLGVHVAEHQHGAAAGVLHDGRQQASALAPIQVLQFRHRRTSMPSARSCRLRSGIAMAPE